MHRLVVLPSLLLLLPALSTANETGSAPDQAVCRACEVRGAGHGVEKVVATRQRDGDTYHFCSEPCGEAFDEFPAAYLRLPVPRPAPTATVTAMDGQDVDLAEVEGELVLLDFWATWCRPCLKAIPDLRELADDYREHGLRVVGVSIDEKSVEDVRKFAEKKDMTYDVVLDGGEAPAWYAFGVAAVPSAFLLDSERRIVAEWKGGSDPDDVRREVAARLGPQTD